MISALDAPRLADLIRQHLMRQHGEREQARDPDIYAMGSRSTLIAAPSQSTLAVIAQSVRAAHSAALYAG